MTAETDLLPLPKPLPRVLVHVLHEGDMELEAVGNYYAAEQVRACVSSATEAARANLAELQREVEGLRAEVERLRQLVNGGRGQLPDDAVAWLDMSPGEASLAFDKRTDSNRANKRRVMDLFQRVSAGYYPLYLEPQADRAERLAEALREITDYDPVGGDEWLSAVDLLQKWAKQALHPTAAQEGE